MILVVGYTYENEGEYVISTDNMKESAAAGKLIGKKGTGGDRENLSLVAEDQALIDAIRVEARLRGVTEGQPAIHNRRDGIHYL